VQTTRGASWVREVILYRPMVSGLQITVNSVEVSAWSEEHGAGAMCGAALFFATYTTIKLSLDLPFVARHWPNWV
jgi:hypothetical protein